MSGRVSLIGRTGKCFDVTCRELFPQARMLNIGCANGWLERFLSEARKDAIFHACELNTHRLLQEREGTADNIFYTAASALHLPYGDSRFDLVSCFDVIEHIPRNLEPLMLNEIRRVLKPSGTLLLSTPRKSFFNNATDFAWYFGHRHYSLRKLQYLITQTGFAGIAHEFQGGKYELLETWALYFCKYIIQRDIPGWLRKRLAAKIASEKADKRGISLFIKAQKAELQQ